MLRRLLGERGEPRFPVQPEIAYANVACSHRIAPGFIGQAGYLEVRPHELVFRGARFPRMNADIPLAAVVEVQEKRMRVLGAPILVVVTARQTHEFVANVNLFGNTSMREVIALVRWLVARRDGGEVEPAPHGARGISP